MELKDCVAMVTGANSGIGLRVTQHFLQLGMVVIGLDKNIDNLKIRNGHRTLHVLKVDLTKEEEVTNAFKWSEEKLGGIDILINNAGVGGASSLLDGNTTEWRNIFELNVLAFTQCAVEAVKSMTKRNIKNGSIINIISTAAYYIPSIARLHFYSATKHAAKVITEGLRKEVNSKGVPIRICNISPGRVKTGFIKNSVGEEMEKYIYTNHPSLNPATIASAIEYIIRSPQNVNISEIHIMSTNEKE